MISRSRIPGDIAVDAPELGRGYLFWADPAVRTWEEVKADLSVAFEGSREAARAEEPIVYVVATDALLGRSGPGPAMVASGLLSAARTAAIEGSRKGWTANVVAHDPDRTPEEVLSRAVALLADQGTTGELIHIGPGHIGKALT